MENMDSLLWFEQEIWRSVLVEWFENLCEYWTSFCLLKFNYIEWSVQLLIVNWCLIVVDTTIVLLAMTKLPRGPYEMNKMLAYIALSTTANIIIQGVPKVVGGN